MDDEQWLRVANSDHGNGLQQTAKTRRRAWCIRSP